MSYIQKGTREFRLTSLALFAGGFNTFAILYSTQPLMPFLSKEFGISPTVASLSLSVVTCTLAVSMLFFGSIIRSVRTEANYVLFSFCDIDIGSIICVCSKF